MTKTIKRFFYTPLAIILLFTSCFLPIPKTDTHYHTARITAVVDGDTVKIQFTDAKPDECEWNEKVRLIGVDTPELYTKPPEYFAVEARDYVNQYYQKDILFEFDTVSARRDRYSRLLGYIYIDGSPYSLNEELIEEGYGYYYDVFAFDRDRMIDFADAEKRAKQNKKGLWK